MVKKRDFVIRVNGGAKKSAKRYRYSYSNTKGIILQLSSNSATVSMAISSKKSASEFGMRGYQLYDDLLYKVRLAWLLSYGRVVSIEEVTVEVDSDGETVVFDGKKIGQGCPPLCASDFSGRIFLPAEWQSERVMNEVLSIGRSRASHRMATLNALVLAKMKTERSGASDIAERFSNSWTALNGYYNYIVSRARPGKKLYDREKMGICLRLHNLGNCSVMEKHQAKLARTAIQAIEGTRCLQDQLPLGSEKRLEAFSQTLKKFEAEDGTCPYEDLTLYGYLLFCLPYYFRCQLLHGTKPLPLFVYETDERVWCLPLLSDLIEVFLDENLWRLFDGDELDAIDQKLLS
ncbi:MAG: hypothetical protein IJI68_08775 [Eggerthellaceae bacterium]|nr:hypothetical protein [Eggerthellaceae bacterium]